MTFGQYTRRRREVLRKTDGRFSVHQIAQRIGVEPAYLSKIERDEVAPPSEEKIRTLARELDEDPNVLLALAGKVSSDLLAIIRKRPQLFAELADVILANPPFMSPKGGIKPHKRFSVDATRSEVLFVDYIAEHLTPNGRAAVVVPEGIIFQSGSAYKQLREMLLR